MNDAISECASVLQEAGFTVSYQAAERACLLFEDPTVLGFLFVYADPLSLLGHWRKDSEAIVAKNRFGLRRAGQKAWNTYCVFLSQAKAEHVDLCKLSAIDEDLVGMRKIARAGVQDSVDVRDALLPLLRLQAAPSLEAVDIVAEIKVRVSALPGRAVEAFLSTNVEEGVVVQVLEDEA